MFVAILFCFSVVIKLSWWGLYW